MNKIHVYWWALGARGAVDNYGDILAPYLAEKLSGKQVVKVSHPMQRWYKWFIKHYVTVGSIICAASKNSIVWGSGIIKQNENVRAAKFVAVRGPRTRKRLLELGYSVPEVYGDPALLLPKFIPNTVEKMYTLGIIPHYVDYDSVVAQFKDHTTVKVINLMTDDVVKTTKEILECEQIISSSLHGVIVSHAYEIPALWVKFSTKLAGDNVKFYDYFESLDMAYFQEFYINPSESLITDFEKLLIENTAILLPSKNKLIQTQEALLASCPFKK
jgi:pyruvyltransferase